MPEQIIPRFPAGWHLIDPKSPPSVRVTKKHPDGVYIENIIQRKGSSASMPGEFYRKVGRKRSSARRR